MAVNNNPAFDQAIAAAKQLEVVKQIARGDFNNIQLTDVRHLFTLLDVDHDGMLDHNELTIFLNTVMDPPCPQPALEELEALLNETSDGTIGADYFHSFLTIGPLRWMLKESAMTSEAPGMGPTGTHASGSDEGPQGEPTSVPRDFMVSRLQWRTSRDEAFRTLPFIVIYFLTFLTLVITHLRVWDRQMLERAMEGHVAGWGYKYTGPYLEDHLPNVDQVWAWLETSGVQAFYGYCHKDADKNVRPPFCEVAPRNMLIGDIMLRQQRLDDSIESTWTKWLLHTDSAKAILAIDPDKRYDAALKAVKDLRAAKWADDRTLTMEVAFSAYNEDSQLFSVSTIRIRFDPHGLATHSAYTYAIPAESYPDIWVFVPDLMYLILLLIPFKDEVLEVANAIRGGGCAGFKEYWGFWNVVDWFMIINGSIVIQLWIQICMAIENDSVQSLLDFPDYSLKSTTADKLTIPQLETIYDDLKQTIFLYRILHVLMAFNTVAIMWKFAKSFQANARLQVVQKALQIAVSDVCHFMIVFFLVFTGFAVVGHILFGGDMRAFNSFGASFNTAFLCLLGDFGWYSDLTMEMTPLGSGMPYEVVNVWFWSFMIFTVLIMMNMLLAIVMDNYGTITADLKTQPDAPAIWVQTSRFMARRKLFKQGQWMSLDKLYDIMDSEKSPVHPETAVTGESLMAAIPELKPDQAKFVMKWLLKDQKANASKNEANAKLAHLKQLETFTQNVAANIHVIYLAVARLTCKIQDLQDTGFTLPLAGEQAAMPNNIMPSEPAAEPTEPVPIDSFPEVTSQLESQLRVMRELCGQFGKQQQSTQNLAVALAELTNVPK